MDPQSVLYALVLQIHNSCVMIILYFWALAQVFSRRSGIGYAVHGIFSFTVLILIRVLYDTFQNDPFFLWLTNIYSMFSSKPKPKFSVHHVDYCCYLTFKFLNICRNMKFAVSFYLSCCHGKIAWLRCITRLWTVDLVATVDCDLYIHVCRSLLSIVNATWLPCVHMTYYSLILTTQSFLHVPM